MASNDVIAISALLTCICIIIPEFTDPENWPANSQYPSSMYIFLLCLFHVGSLHICSVLRYMSLAVLSFICVCHTLITSNVTGRHRGPKRKLRAGYRALSGHPLLCAVTHIVVYCTSPGSITHVIFFTVGCGIARFLCYVFGMCVFNVRASSSLPRLPLCQISFLSCSSLLS